MAGFDDIIKNIPPGMAWEEGKRYLKEQGGACDEDASLVTSLAMHILGQMDTTCREAIDKLAAEVGFQTRLNQIHKYVALAVATDAYMHWMIRGKDAQLAAGIIAMAVQARIMCEPLEKAVLASIDAPNGEGLHKMDNAAGYVLNRTDRGNGAA